MTPQPPSVAVVGGGIGGLFTAHALMAADIPVTVYEQAPQLGEVGAGVYLTPNSVRQLDRVGLGEAVRRAGAPVGPESMYHRADGRPIAPVQVTDSSGNPAYGMHRADLITLLAETLPADVVRTGHRCSGITQDADSVRLTFDGGEEAHTDIVVAADGIHSILRSEVAPPSAPVFSGSVAYRGTLPATALPTWPTDRWLMWLGTGKHFLVFPLRGGQLINYVGFVPADEEMRESWSAPGNPDQLRAEFAGWDEAVEGLLDQVRHTFRWGLYDRDPMPTWTRGRLTLLGDAAHPMLPHLGQGANQSIEDGIALATVLAGADRATAPAALPAYERLRRERVASVQDAARVNGLRYDSSSHSDLGLRDAELSAHAEFRRWLYDYDVVPEARELATSPS